MGLGLGAGPQRPRCADPRLLPPPHAHKDQWPSSHGRMHGDAAVHGDADPRPGFVMGRQRFRLQPSSCRIAAQIASLSPSAHRMFLSGQDKQSRRLLRPGIFKMRWSPQKSSFSGALFRRVSFGPISLVRCKGRSVQGPGYERCSTRFQMSRIVLELTP